MYRFLRNYSYGNEIKDEKELLTSASYTLQVGRESMEARCVIIGNSKDEILKSLKGYVKNDKNQKNLLTGFIDNKKNSTQTLLDKEDHIGIVRRAIEDKNFLKLAKLWVTGFDIDWNLLYTKAIETFGGVRPKRIPLPTYAFNKTRYWVPESSSDETQYSAVSVKTRKLHSLLDENISTLFEQRFKSRFYGGEFFLKDHIVFDSKVLPGVVYLEMMRAAGELAGETKVKVLKNVVWITPVIYQGSPFTLYTSVSPAQHGAEVEVYSMSDDKEILHAKGEVSFKGPIIVWNALSTKDGSITNRSLSLFLTSGSRIIARDSFSLKCSSRIPWKDNP